MVHGYLPVGLILVVLVPIIKSKSGNISSKDNYRPLSLSSVISKLLEITILNRIRDLMCTSDNQFGFKAKSGTTDCVYMFKDIIHRYKRHNSSIFACYLDASKAFDRIHFGLLFEMLIERNVPLYIVRIVAYWYNCQSIYVRWGEAVSLPFKVYNGIKQEGVLSPMLFNIYIWISLALI